VYTPVWCVLRLRNDAWPQKEPQNPCAECLLHWTTTAIGIELSNMRVDALLSDLFLEFELHYSDFLKVFSPQNKAKKLQPKQG